MKRSTDRILTTHVGSLIRPPALREYLRAKETGEPLLFKGEHFPRTDIARVEIPPRP